MKKVYFNSKLYGILAMMVLFLLLYSNTAHPMALYSFVALPVETNNAVIRISDEYNDQSKINTITTSAGYGISSTQTLFMGIPTQTGVGGGLGDISILYRHMVLQLDNFSGTNRIAALIGLIEPNATDENTKAQSGFVFTHFKNKNEIDLDVIYLPAINNNKQATRYDISWQYRLSPNNLPQWGIGKQIYSVLEFNGLWKEGHKSKQKLVIGLQLVQADWVLETGIRQDVDNSQDKAILISGRFHFF